MEVLKKDLKDFITIAKRFSKQKETLKVFVQVEEEDLYMQVGIKGFALISKFKVENVEENDLKTFEAKVYEFETLLKGRDKMVSFEYEDKKLKIGEASIEVEFKEKISLKIPSISKSFNEPERFVEILKEADSLLVESEQACTSYLKFNQKNALIAEPKRIHYYRWSEELGLEQMYMHKDFVSILAKSLNKKGALNYIPGNKSKMAIIQDNKYFFVVNLESKVNFPDLNKIIANSKAIGHVSLNSDEVFEVIKKYKKEVNMVEFELEDDYIKIDSRNEESGVSKIEILGKSGIFHNALFEKDAIKGLFGSYDGKINLELVKFKNVYGEEAYQWRVITSNKIIMIAGIEEPNWDEIKINSGL